MIEMFHMLIIKTSLIVTLDTWWMNQGANYRMQYTRTVQCLFIVSIQQIHNTWCTTWWLPIIHCNIFVNFNICCIVLSLYSILIMRPINYSCMLVSIILLMQVNFHYVYLPLSVSTIMKRREVDSCKSNWCGEGGGGRKSQFSS